MPVLQAGNSSGRDGAGIQGEGVRAARGVGVGSGIRAGLWAVAGGFVVVYHGAVEERDRRASGGGRKGARGGERSAAARDVVEGTLGRGADGWIGGGHVEAVVVVVGFGI